MSRLDLPVFSPAAARRAEEASFALGQAPEALMERVAVGVAAWAAAVGLAAPGPLVALAGPGLNGADALAACRILAERGWRCLAFRLGPEPAAGTLAARQAALWRAAGGTLAPFDEAAASAFEPAAVLDGGLGLGGRPALAGELARAVAWANAQPGALRLALDGPTGLDLGTGAGAEGAFRAHHTLALGSLKPGLLVDPALASVGALWRLPLGLPEPEAPEMRLLAPAPLPGWPPAAHKGTKGTLLVLAGSRGMPGAAVLAAKAAVAAGAGLVAVAGLDPAVPASVAAALPEAIALPDAAAATLAPWLARADALVAGPGWPAPALEEALAGFGGPAVLDAGALGGLLAGAGPRVLTPHAGEAGRLLGRSAAEVQGDRPGSARRLAARAGSTVVLKGARTLVASPDGALGVCPTGDPLLATAGSGDALAGLLGALLARGLPPREAAEAAVAWHAQAGAEAAREGMLSLRASVLAERFAARPLRAPGWAVCPSGLERIR